MEVFGLVKKTLTLKLHKFFFLNLHKNTMNYQTIAIAIAIILAAFIITKKVQLQGGKRAGNVC
tara:strand:+ start:2390 stop:2578 length:189 start_codon:yes stop_codon:yes gene_type:complete